MPLELHDFRPLGTDKGTNYEINLQQNGQGQQTVAHGESRLSGRLHHWKMGEDLDRQQLIADRRPAKMAFVNALAQAEGPGAVRALRAAGLDDGWIDSDRPLSSRVITKVLDKAQEFRAAAVRQNESAMQALLPPAYDLASRDERSAIIAAVRGHSEYGSQTMSANTLQGIVQTAQDQVRAKAEAQCAQRFPGLSALAALQNPQAPRHALTLVSQMRARMPDAIPHDSSVRVGTRQLNRATELLGRAAWDQTSMAQLDTALADLHLQMDITQLAMLFEKTDLQAQKDKAATDLADARVTLRARIEQRSSAGLIADAQGSVDKLAAHVTRLDSQLDLLGALEQDLPHQQELIESKRTYLQELRSNDPLSQRAVAHGTLIYAQAGDHVIEKLAQGLADGSITQSGQQPNIAALQTAWQDVVAQLAWDYVQSDNQNQSVPAPTAENKSTHPVKIGQQAVLVALRHELKTAHVSDAIIKALTQDKPMREAQRMALSTSDLWQPVDRKMLIMRDGAATEYTSKITPAQHWNADFKARYTHGGQLRGVTAADAGNADHARNLKVSELMQGNTRLATVVGHGVLDMWKIKDPAQRAQANTNGAKEVLELAAASNPRLQIHLNAGNAMTMTHVSVNLISPDTLRSTWLVAKAKPDYAENDYTQAQFRAFEAHSGPRTLQVYNPGTQATAAANVTIDPITFSFGINSLATSSTSTAMLGVWRNVHAHNTDNMIKLVGDLGSGNHGAVGARPGGFIGQVYDQLETGKGRAAAPADAQKLDGLQKQLQVQTDLVRQMFTNKAYESGNGDTAKMGREILALQALAEQSLSTLEGLQLGGNDMAATMSKGCKSDKDRGGVTDVELKSKLILQDMGGDMAPDARLVGDDQELYYTVSAGSGQLENQRWNTGLGGSKEAGHLLDRIPSLQVRQFLAGLGAFAKA
ncbi:inositol phosphate phosphatase SopB [Bordetella sp. BOR01]|uniref:inositol phosphate phosphatase SopB n=1 Tax=Bordetella sp. BOR01 TaxID=2854779 RepID=UPI001C45DCE5|nr:inositol phosphate phosphatase SopB [Bordetella sp. BOR01]MBV7486819.1 hypothetical protein [Bordetella sp. BOR01]